MTRRVTNLRSIIVRYYDQGRECVGTNLLYMVDGSPRSSRVNWVVSNPEHEVARLEKLLKVTGQ